MSTLRASDNTNVAKRTSEARSRILIVVSTSASNAELARARLLAQEHNATVVVARIDRPAHFGAFAKPAAPPRVIALVSPARDLFGRPLAERAHNNWQCPVLQVRRDEISTYMRVVIAVDVDSKVNDMVVAARLVAPGVPVSFVHAYESAVEPRLILDGAGPALIAHHRRARANAARKQIRALVNRAGFHDHPLHLEAGAARFVLLGVPSDALLVIDRGRSWLKHAVFGSVTRWVLQESSSDVLVV